jgi:aryl-alcohol dehydrogenase-like predicted oxidoreductase
VKSPWFGSGRQGGTADIVIHRPAGDETITLEEPRWLYTFEIDATARAIRNGAREFEAPGMTAADTLGNMKVLDEWRAGVGLEFELEKPHRRLTTIAGRSLPKKPTPMRRTKVAGLPRDISVIAFGGALLESYTHAQILLDAYYEAGGNLLDTGWIYRLGKIDRYFGDWMAARGVRDDIAIIGKGAHSPLTYPDVIGRQLTESLDRLRTDRIDVYFMHRDNPAVPVGEFVDAMDAEAAAGRIGIFGGSNWTRERMDAAIAYAEKNGRRPPAAISNNFSLAEMVNPVWPGVLAASDDAWKAWLRQRGLPLFAWSSQARGFFTDRAAPDRLSDKELVNAWYSDRNFARRARAIALGERLGKTPLHVALAYCLAQDFPVVPIIGPLAVGELEDSLQALDITLSPADVRWLEEGSTG